MKLEVKIIKCHEQLKNIWSGGTTTQISIYPYDAVHAEREFCWRLSTATVEVEESEFTYLPGYKRILMILEGSVELVHNGHHKAMLMPFEKDIFYGDWTTKSIGRAEDFNLMLADCYDGDLKHINVDIEPYTINIKSEALKKAFIGFYVYSGEVEISVNEQLPYIAHNRDFVITDIEDYSGNLTIKIINKCMNSSDIILTQINEK